MSQKFLPSLLFAEVFHPYKREKDFTAEVIETLVEKDFYRSVEVGDGFEEQERKRIRKVTESNGIVVTQWLTFLLEENNLDVSTIDSNLRKETVRQVKESLYHSAEIGAENVALVPGDNLGTDSWPDSVEAMYESLCEIAEEAQKYQMNLLVEPLDRFAHKRRVIGTTEETVQLLNRVKKDYGNIGIAFDTAHAALNEEDVLEALEKGKELIHQIHFSNAVLDKTSKRYGDFHMDIGEPGFLTKNKIASILAKADQLGIQSERGLRIAAEVRGKGDKEACFRNESQLRNLLSEVLGSLKATQN